MADNNIIPDLSVELCGVKLKNPVMPASGTFSARESGEFYDIGRLGAAVTKGVSDVPWPGNPTPRIAEVTSGMMNSVGLQNPGVDWYIKNELPYLRQFDTPVIANIAGHSEEEYCEVIRRLNDTDVALYEVNISCPNIKEGGILFGTDPLRAGKITEALKAAATKPVIVKLTPNVTDITVIAKAVESAGADGISMINSLRGMKIDLKTRRPVLAMKTGGFTGPAIKPVALRMVWEVCSAVKIPVIGMGGITTGEDAAEFLAVGAACVAAGTASLADPTALIKIIDGLSAYMAENGFKDLKELREAFDI